MNCSQLEIKANDCKELNQPHKKAVNFDSCCLKHEQGFTEANSAIDYQLT